MSGSILLTKKEQFLEEYEALVRKHGFFVGECLGEATAFDLAGEAKYYTGGVEEFLGEYMGQLREEVGKDDW